MGKLLNTVLTLGMLGAGAYFTIKYIIPKLPPPGSLQLPQFGGSGKPSLPQIPSLPGTSSIGGVIGTGGTDLNGIKLVYKATGNKVALPSKASPHENGDRYSAQHKFINYIIVAYLKGSHGAQGCKMDGPNHGKCQSKKPDCFWIDPDLQMSDGSIKYGAEYPHPKAHSVPCASCKKAGISLGNKWYGYQGICYQGSGGPSDRWNEVWVDIGAGSNGEPGNKWVNLLKENYTKNIPADWRRPNGLPINCSSCGSGTGLEAEIRMRGANGTSIKNGMVVEIVNPVRGGASAYTRAYYGSYYGNNFNYGQSVRPLNPLPTRRIYNNGGYVNNRDCY